jgi:2-oxo-4-hydroxy-4-carboxy--5-ureidoimidazoline (OHCU) decarboxylase
MIEGLRDVWSKLTPEEQQELGQALEKAFQEEFDREFIAAIKKEAQKDILD